MLDVTHYLLKNQCILKNCTVALISDFHRCCLESQIQDALLDLEPDLIFITGDLIDGKKPDIPKSIAFVQSLCSAAPVFFCPGNHEKNFPAYPLLREQLVNLGVSVLEDSFHDLPEFGISVAGAADFGANADSLSFHLMKDRLSNRYSSLACSMAYPCRLLLCHRPDFFPFMAAAGFTAMFTGHRHGGQWRLFGKPLYCPDAGFFPSHAQGVWSMPDHKSCFISRGLGNTSRCPIRIFNHPELVVVHIVK